MSTKNKKPIAAQDTAVHTLFILANVWIISLCATAFASLLTGLIIGAVNTALIIFILFTILLVIIIIMYRKKSAQNKYNLHFGYKKCIGYFLVLQFIASSIPRVYWVTSNALSPAGEAFLFLINFISLIIGIVLFIYSGKLSSLVGLGILPVTALSDKKIYKQFLTSRKKKSIIKHILEWADALGFAVIFIIILNTFILQLYVIPSESMVPTFLTNDRPLAVKFLSGPKIPMTNFRLPILKYPTRGDVIVIANPRYPENDSIHLKKYLAQLVTMITFTAINLDRYLPNGAEKADPLVKRIVGLPGEKLMMIDDILYKKTKNETNFTKVEQDAAWANYNVWQKAGALPPKSIRTIPIAENERLLLDKWDAIKNSSNASVLENSIANTNWNIEKLMSHPAVMRQTQSTPEINLTSLIQPTFLDQNTITTIAHTLHKNEELYTIIRKLLSTRPVVTPLKNSYEKNAQIINLLLKSNIAKRIESTLTVLIQPENQNAKFTEQQALTDAEELAMYLRIYDARNFPEFPSGDMYLKDKQYFGMGDNRYNSIDFRSKDYTPRKKPIDKNDPYSIYYFSTSDPFALDLKYIEGYTPVLLWPPNRMGVIK